MVITEWFVSHEFMHALIIGEGDAGNQSSFEVFVSLISFIPNENVPNSSFMCLLPVSDLQLGRCHPRPRVVQDCQALLAVRWLVQRTVLDNVVHTWRVF